MNKTRDLPLGTVITPNGLYAGLWALPRPQTQHWGSGLLLPRIEGVWGAVDIVFGKQDGVYGFSIDNDIQTTPSVCANWQRLPFRDGQFRSGYWDPPYLGYIGDDGDVHYSRLQACFEEILRVLNKRVFILSPLVYPCPDGWKREAVIAITMGPNKVIRALQAFERKGSGGLNPPSLREIFLLSDLPLFARAGAEAEV
jgi:hypothetical protein